MTQYIKAELPLTKTQAKALQSALDAGSTTWLKFSYKQLTAGSGHNMLLTNTQFNRVQKALDNKKGVTLTLSKRQISMMQTRGFITPIIASILGALALTIFNRLFPSQSGQSGEGMMNEGNGDSSDDAGAGILLPGSKKGAGCSCGGAILGGNSDPANLRVEGRMKYLPESNGSKSMGRGMPKKKGMALQTQAQMQNRAGAGTTYMDPQSEKFQMLQ